MLDPDYVALILSGTALVDIEGEFLQSSNLTFVHLTQVSYFRSALQLLDPRRSVTRHVMACTGRHTGFRKKSVERIFNLKFDIFTHLS